MSTTSEEGRIAAPAESVDGPRRPAFFEAGLFLVVVVTPLAFLPLTHSPFGDLKFVTLAAGVLLLWVSRPSVDRPIAIAAACWVGASVLATLFGVDWRHSLTGDETSPAGLALVLTSAYLVSIGPAVPGRMLRRIPAWLAVTATAIAVTVVVWRLAPTIFSFMPGVSLDSSTLGHGVFLASFLALGLVALPHVDRPLWQIAPAAALIGIALGGTPHRSALVFSAIAFVFSVWHAGVARRRVVTIAAAAAVAFFAWSLLLPAGWVTSPAPALAGRESSLTTSFADRSDSRRFSAISAIAAGTLDRPVFGWGPGNTMAAWLAGQKGSGAPVEGQFSDAHNIVVEEFAATGLVGGVAFLVLACMLGLRILRRPRPTGWIAGAVVILVFLHLLEPLNVAMTSLGFLFLGIAARKTPAVSREAARSWEPAARVVTGVGLAGVLVVALLTLGSAALEQYEHTYFTPGHGPLLLAKRLTPWRIKTIDDLATQLAVDGRSGDTLAAVEATDLADRMVAEHPWYPVPWLVAINVHRLVLDGPGAQGLVDRYHSTFPLLPIPTLGGPIAPPEIAPPETAPPETAPIETSG